MFDSRSYIRSTRWRENPRYRVYLAPTYGRFRHMRKLDYWHDALSFENAPNDIFCLEDRRLTLNEYGLFEHLAAQCGVAQFENILDELNNMRLFSPRSESEERLYVCWRLACLQHPLRCDWNRLTLLDLHIVQQVVPI